MKKLVLALFILVVLCFVAVSCGNAPDSTTAPEATTPEATTVAQVTTTVTTQEQTAEVTTEATTEKIPEITQMTPFVPEVIVDIDFKGNEIVDNQDNITITQIGSPTVGAADVTHNGSTYNTSALKTSNGNYYICQFKEYDTPEVFKQVMAMGFSVEAFYVAGPATNVQGIVCGTQGGGWGLANRATNVPYFIVGTGIEKNTYNNVDASTVISTTELTHVIAVYDYDNQKLVIYINGQLSAEAPLNIDYFCGISDTFNRFCIGDDIKIGNIGGDFPTNGGMTLVDAKIYSGAVDMAAASYLYVQAVKSISK